MTHEKLFQKGISINRLHTLVMVADKGSIAAAAGQDDLARQSQFSHQIKDLEIALGRKLTERRGRTLRLTPAGTRLAALTREHLLTLSRFAEEEGAELLNIRIGAGESTLNWLLTPHLGDLARGLGREACWSFTTCRSEEIRERLLDQRLDFGIVRGFPETPRLKQFKLGIMDNRLFVPRLLLESPVTSTWEAITRLPLALLEGGAKTRLGIEKACRLRNCRPLVRYECTTAIQSAALITNGLAAAPLPEIARRHFDPAKVVDMSLKGILERERPLCLVWNPRTLAMSSSLETLRQTLCQTLALPLPTGSSSAPASARGLLRHPLGDPLR